MTLDDMTGRTKGSYTGFCKSQLITCNFVKTCNGVCPFEDALKHADKMQTRNEQHTVNHDRLYIKIYEDDEPSVKAEKLYQICDETQNREVAKWLKEYFPSADTEPKWNCTANFVAEQLDRLKKMSDEEKWEFFKRFFETKGGAE